MPDIKIGFDLDGVLCNSSVVFRTLIYKEYGTYDFRDIDDKGNERFKFRIEGVTDASIWNVIKEALVHYQSFMAPVEGAVQFVRNLHTLTGKPIEIISARPCTNEIATETHAWCQYNLQVPYHLTLVNPPENGSKDEDMVKNLIVKQFELEYFVEDRLKYSSQISKVDCIKKVFLLNRIYNMGRRTAEKVVRVDNFPSIGFTIFQDTGMLIL